MKAAVKLTSAWLRKAIIARVQQIHPIKGYIAMKSGVSNIKTTTCLAEKQLARLWQIHQN